jgi:hypothetical protein
MTNVRIRQNILKMNNKDKNNNLALEDACKVLHSGFYNHPGTNRPLYAVYKIYSRLAGNY